MPRLTIPSEYRPGLVKLQELSAGQIDELIGALRSAPIKFYRTDLADVITERVRSIEPSVIHEVTETVSSLEFVRATAEVSIDEFLVDLNEALEREDLPTTNSDGSSTVERIKQLLQINSIGIPAKARTLLLQGSTLCSSKVVTDIRPVFDASDVPGPPEAALIVHNLRISYHEGGSRALREFVVALDSDDLDSLIDTLNRAKAKENALEGLLKTAATSYLKIE